jgi:hypothetical protein
MPGVQGRGVDGMNCECGKGTHPVLECGMCGTVVCADCQEIEWEDSELYGEVCDICADRLEDYE